MTVAAPESILLNPPLSPKQDATRHRMTESFCRAEAEVVGELLRIAEVDAETQAKVTK